MHSQQSYRVMALAAVCQAVELVRLLSREPASEVGQLDVMLNSITVVDADNPLQIYGDWDNLKLGYEVLNLQLGHQTSKDVEITRYIAGILTLERKLHKKRGAMDQLSQRITDLQRQLTHFDLMDNNILANIASIYTEVVSPLGNRIQVTGLPQYLKVQNTQYKIRALLLAAIRAAVLWRQLGGKRRHFLLSRQAILDVAQQTFKHN